MGQGLSPAPFNLGGDNLKKKIIAFLSSIFIFLFPSLAQAATYNMGPATVYIHATSAGDYQSSNMAVMDLNGNTSTIKSITIKGYLASGDSFGIGFYNYDGSGTYIGTDNVTGLTQLPTTYQPTSAGFYAQAFLTLNSVSGNSYIYVSDFEGYNHLGGYDYVHFDPPADYTDPGGGTGGNPPPLPPAPITPPPAPPALPYNPPTPPPAQTAPSVPQAPTMSASAPNFPLPPPYQPKPSNPVNIPIPTYSKPPIVESPGPLPPSPDIYASVPDHDAKQAPETPIAKEQPLSKDTPLSVAPLPKDPPLSVDTIQRDTPLARDTILTDPILQRDSPLTPDPPP